MSLNVYIIRSVGLTDQNFEFLLEKNGGFNCDESREKNQHIVIVYHAKLRGIIA